MEDEGNKFSQKQFREYRERKDSAESDSESEVLNTSVLFLREVEREPVTRDNMAEAGETSVGGGTVDVAASLAEIMRMLNEGRSQFRELKEENARNNEKLEARMQENSLELDENAKRMREDNERFEAKFDLNITSLVEQLSETNSKLDRITGEFKEEIQGMKTAISENKETLEGFMMQSRAQFEKNEKDLVEGLNEVRSEVHQEVVVIEGKLENTCREVKVF